MFNKLKSWIAKHFVSKKFEFPILTAEESFLIPVGVELA